MCVARVASYTRHVRANGRLDAFDLFEQLFALVRLARRNPNVHDDPVFVLNGGMLLVGRLKVVLLTRGRHRGIGIGRTVFLWLRFLRTRTTLLLRSTGRGIVVIALVCILVCTFVVRRHHLFDVTRGQAVPTDIGAN